MRVEDVFWILVIVLIITDLKGMFTSHWFYQLWIICLEVMRSVICRRDTRTVSLDSSGPNKRRLVISAENE